MHLYIQKNTTFGCVLASRPSIKATLLSSLEQRLRREHQNDLQAWPVSTFGLAAAGEKSPLDKGEAEASPIPEREVISLRVGKNIPLSLANIV